MANPVSPPKYRFYGRRQGKRLRAHQQHLVDDLLPKIRIRPPEDGGRIAVSDAFSDAGRPVWMEVGFGAGEHLLGQAARHPDINFIGCEAFMNGIAQMLGHLEKQGQTNIRLWDEDARWLMDRLPDRCLDRFYLLFPDPWPKVRHHKRRFVTPESLDAIARLLKPGGEFRFASDHMDYVHWTLERLTAHPSFQWQAHGKADWARPADWIETRYEAKAVKEGLKPAYLRFHRAD